MSEDRTLHLDLIAEPLAEGGVMARIPAVPGAIAWGEDEAVAIENARQVILAFVASYRDHGDPFPQSLLDFQASDPKEIRFRISVPAEAA